MNQSARPGPKRAVNIQSAIASRVAAIVPDLDGEALDAISAGVADVLTDPAVTNELAEIVHESLLSTSNFRSEFEDEPDRFWDSRDCAEIAVATAIEVITERESHRYGVADAAKAHALLRDVAYKDWRFDVVRNGDRIGVRVTATVPNAVKAGSTFTTSRTTVIADDVLEAAFRAIMQLEEHEARERLRVGGARPLNPHDGSSAMPPSGARSYEPHTT